MKPRNCTEEKPCLTCPALVDGKCQKKCQEDE